MPNGPVKALRGISLHIDEGEIVSLLGANGVVIIGHGSSNALATFNGIRVAAEAVDHHVNHLIEAELERIKDES